MRYRVLLLDTKPSNPNHYIGIAVADALRDHALVEAVFPAHYGNALDLARRNSCNLFFAWDGEELNAALCERLAYECGRSVLWVTEDPYELDQNLRNAQYFDCVFTNDSASVAAYSGKATHLPFAASDLIHAGTVPEDEKQYLYDVLFVGTAWPNRVRFLQQLLAKKPDLKYKIGLPGNEHLPEPDLPLPKSQYDWRVANSELCRLASKSRVVLTLHREFSASNNPVCAATPGPRLFETALAGGFQLVDMSQPEVAQLYAKDTEFIGFSTLEEAITGIEWALSHPDRRRDIARAAQLHTRKEHLYAHRIKQVLASVEKIPAPQPGESVLAEKARVLFLSHNIVQNQPFGGVEVYQDLLQKELADHYDIYIYSAVQHKDGTQDYTLLGPDGSIVERFCLKNSVSNDVISDPERERIFSAVLDKYDFSLVHVHHLMYHPMGLPYLVRAFGIPLTVTFHDYYLLCKRFNLLDYRGEYCGPGVCSTKECDRCMQEILIPAGEHGRWRSFAGAMLDLFDRYIISVKSVADLIALTYPQIAMAGRTELLPLPTRKLVAETPVEKDFEAGWLHVAVPGNFTHPKGAEVLLAVFVEMRAEPVRFHILGRIDEPYNRQMESLKLNNVLMHGGYLPEDADALLARMSVSLILSIWPETYVLTLSETWNNSIVPIVADIGALGERVKDGVNGFKVRPRNVQDVVDRLRMLRDNPCLLEQVRQTMVREKLFPTVEEHLTAIRTVYRSLIPIRRRPKATLTGKGSACVPSGLTLRDCGILVQTGSSGDGLRPDAAVAISLWQRLVWLLKVGVLSLKKNGFKLTVGKTVRWMQKKTRGIRLMQTKRILLVGASPDKFNRNSVIRDYVAEGIVSLLGKGSLLQSSLEQAPLLIEMAKPQVVLVFGSCMPSDADYLHLYWAGKKWGSSLVFWLHDDPYEFDYHYKILAYADYIFSNDRWSWLHYEHEQAYHLPMAASPTAHRRNWCDTKTVDLFFCGVAFPNRIKLIRDIQQLSSQYSMEIIGADWPAGLACCKNRRIDNAELSDRYAQSLATLNLGRSFNYANERYCLSASTPGPRTFEAAMAGACQLFFVDSLEIEDYFVPKQEILLFDSVDELSAALKRLKAEPALAQSIGQAAQARCLKDHTYEARIRQLLQLIGWSGQE